MKFVAVSGDEAEWHMESCLGMVSLWLWKPISSVFAQYIFSFRGQNPIIETRCVTAGLLRGSGNVEDTAYVFDFPLR